MENFKIYLEIKVIDKNGRIKVKKRKDSAVYNLGRILYGLLVATGNAGATDKGTKASVSVKKQDGYTDTAWTERYDQCSTSFDSFGGGTPMGANANEGDDSFGIMVGTGSTPVSDDDYKLESKIPHGDGDNKLHYGSHTFESVEIGSNYARFRMSRSFTNNGTTNITVYEYGIVVRNYWKDYFEIRKDLKFLIARDVDAEGVTLAPGDTLVVTYVFEVSL